MKKLRKDLDAVLAEQLSLTSERGALDQERQLAAERGDEWPGAEGLAPAPLSASEALAAYVKRKVHERQKAECKTRDKYPARRCATHGPDVFLPPGVWPLASSKATPRTATW
jgi:hypothetical protein